MKIGTGNLPALVVALLSVSALASCATVGEASMQAMVPGQRPGLPEKGRNKVYLEFGDQTGQAGDFENLVYDAISRKVEDRGYVLVDPDEADYVLWATLRFFDKTGTAAGNKALASLGGVAGGIAAGVITADLTDSATAGWVAGAGTTGLVALGIEKMTRKDNWAMVIDIQLGRRLDEAQKKTIKTEDQRRIANVTLSETQIGIVNSADAGMSGQSVTTTAERVETSVFGELEQRVVAQVGSRRKSKKDVAGALVETLSNGLAAQMPRLRFQG